MLYLIQNHNRNNFNKTLDNLYRKRCDVFHNELGWDVPTKNGLEIDQYDIDSTIYMVSHDQEHGIVGGIRFLPTTGPNMIKDTFSYLIKDQNVIPNDPKIWESSRFFYRKPRNSNDRVGAARRGTLEIFIGVIEFGITWGLEGILTLTDLRVEKMIKNAGWDFQRICPPIEVDGKPVVVGVMPTNKEVLKRVREQTKIDYPVLMSPLPICREDIGSLDIGSNSHQDLLFSSSSNQELCLPYQDLMNELKN